MVQDGSFFPALLDPRKRAERALVGGRTGGFVLGGAPGILNLVGGTSEQAVRYGAEMREITVASHSVYRIPAFGFDRAPVGIDIRKVVRTGTTPIIDTAIAHKDPGHPMIGAGRVRAPLECFEKALVVFAGKHG